jgi:hypothetical protein
MMAGINRSHYALLGIALPRARFALDRNELASIISLYDAGAAADEIERQNIQNQFEEKKLEFITLISAFVWNIVFSVLIIGLIWVTPFISDVFALILYAFIFAFVYAALTYFDLVKTFPDKKIAITRRLSLYLIIRTIELALAALVVTTIVAYIFALAGIQSVGGLKQLFNFVAWLSDSLPKEILGDECRTADRLLVNALIGSVVTQFIGLVGMWLTVTFQPKQ